MESPGRHTRPVALTVCALGLMALTPGAVQSPAEDDGLWHIRATDARIIGGYGDNFAYDGNDVRELRGQAEVTLNPETGTGRVDIVVSTTPESGPVHFSEDRSWSGTLRIVQRLDTRSMEKARLAEEVWLHGDTGNEAPVMPKLFNYFATWGPSEVHVNGREVIPMIGSHTMFSEEARPESAVIANENGTVYGPMVDDKTGFTDADDTEFHFVAHTTEPDAENFPPHSGWIHLHFSNVQVLEKPGEVEVPYLDR